MTPPAWSGRDRVLLRGGRIHSPGLPEATAMLVDGPRIAWVGDDMGAESLVDSADLVVDLRGALVTAGFVDAHVHTTWTGLTLTGDLDLTDTQSLTQLLATLETAARDARGRALIGHGWDETRWPERRPPTREELDRTTWGSVVFLSRIDGHSAAVSSALVAQIPGLHHVAGWHDTEPLTREAHHLVRESVLGVVAGTARADAQRFTRRHAAAHGVVALHEMAGPTISSAADLADLLTLSAQEPGPLVTGYWGEISHEGGVEHARELGAIGAGGDLFVDGAIGSRTACLCRPYADAPDVTGAMYHDADAIADHIVAATQAGLQAGFHVIGDATAGVIIDGMCTAAARLGVPAVRAARHRLEHAELLSDEHIATLAELGITASMQPVFDALWGGPGGMYETRLGVERTATMNRFADLEAAGVLLAFGSDAPVTSVGPWAAVQAATRHSHSPHSLTLDDALEAHTRGGWASVGEPDTGNLTVGAMAHYAVWEVEEVAADRSDGLPALDDVLPRCLRTVVAGAVVYDAGELSVP